MKFQGATMLIRWWKGPPVIVLVPSFEPVRIRKGSGPIHVMCKVPVGSLRGIPLTQERKRFLIKKGMDPELIKRGYVLDVSDALASPLNKELEATNASSAQCGLGRWCPCKLFAAKKKLSAFQ